MMRIPSLSRLLFAVCSLAALAWLTAACRKVSGFVYTGEEKEGNTEVVVSDAGGNISSLPAGSVLGVYVVDADGNVKLQRAEVDGDGNAVLPTAFGGNTVFAYSPWQEGWGLDALERYPVFSVQTRQDTQAGYQASDLVLGVRTPETRAEAFVLNLRHVMARVAIHIVDETGRVELNDIGIELLNLKKGVTVDILHQQVATVELTGPAILMLSGMSTDWRISSYAIVPPQEVEAGTDFYSVSLFGIQQVFPAPQEIRLTEGSTFTINMRLTGQGLIPDGWSITDWEEEQEREINL